MIRRAVVGTNFSCRVTRLYSTNIFDRDLKFRQKDILGKLNSYNEYQYLHKEVANRLIDRIADIKDIQFEKIVDLGSNLQKEHIDILHKYTNNKILQLSPNGMKKKKKIYH